jgi:hypothetical protein
MKTPLKLAIGAALGVALTSQAQLFQESFDTDPTANWTVNDPGLSDTLADFYYDYSAIGVPSAPNGAGTRGLKLTANNSGGVFSGFSVSPTGQNFTGNYRVSFDLWQNYAGPVGPGGNGTTQLSTFGIGTGGTTAAWPGNAANSTGANGVFFAATLDGGSASDYRAYSSAAPTSYAAGNAVYLAPGGAINESAAYYSVFTSQSAPAAQVALFPGQTGSTSPGEISFAWRRVDILVEDGFATWSVDGLDIARVDLSTVTLGGGNILFGHADTNGGSSTDPNDSLLNITLIDNIVVVPEPSTAALALLGALGFAISRRRK